MPKSTETPKEYLKRPYARMLIPDIETGTYAAMVREFSGCVAQGDTVQEAINRLEAAAERWIQSCLDANQVIPEPIAAREHSGKVVLRLPRSLHQKAAEMAETERTSLNTILVAAVASYVQPTRAASPPPPSQLILSNPQIMITVNTAVNPFNAPLPEYSLEISTSTQGVAGTATTIAQLRRK